MALENVVRMQIAGDVRLPLNGLPKAVTSKHFGLMVNMPDAGQIDTTITSDRETETSRFREVSIGTMTLAWEEPLQRIEIYRGELPDQVARELQVLEENSAYVNFQSAKWQECCQKIQIKNRSVLDIHVIGYRENEAVVHFPLSKAIQFGINYLQWRADNLSDYCSPIIHRDFVDEFNKFDVDKLLSEIAHCLEDIDLIYLRKQPEKLHGYQNPCNGSRSLPFYIKTHSTRLTENWISYYESKRSSKTRRRLKEKRSALQKKGNLDFCMMTDAAIASQMVESGLLMKSQQLRELNHYDTFEDSSSRCLLSAYFGRHIENETWVAGAFMDDEPIAIAFGFKRNDNWFLYQLSMKDDEFGKYSPGTHLMMFILSKAIDGNCKLFEFGLGDEPYKKEWCEIEDETRIELKALTWKGWIACLIHRQKYKLLRHLVHGGKLWRAAKASQKLLKQAGLAG